MTTFSDLGLAGPILDALLAKGYTTPTPIQLQAIPKVMEGLDLLGIAATGTGKTAAFSLPILQRIITTEPTHGSSRGPGVGRGPRALILSPTRELAAQIAANTNGYGARARVRTVALYGGMPMGKQVRDLRAGAEIVVATPGRLLDHVEQGTLSLRNIEVFVLDEADHMLDLGFIPAVRRIVKALPRERQTLLFSATMPPTIRTLADDLLDNPVMVSVAPSATPADRIEQRAILVDGGGKRQHLAQILKEGKYARVIVFTRTKRGADRVAEDLEKAGIGAEAIHGNKSQGQRERTLGSFRTGRTPVLVATDIAARGIDVTGVDLVVNHDLPEVPETYVHRIGRTGRNGAAGLAISLCAPDERSLLSAIERLTKNQIPKSTISGGPIEERPYQERPQARPAPQQQRPATNRLPRAANPGRSDQIGDLPFLKQPTRGRRRRSSAARVA